MDWKITKITTIIFLSAIFTAFPLVSRAVINDATVENYINVSADTGNITEKTNITTGDSSASIHIENTINGERTEPLIIELEAANGENKEIIINNSDTINTGIDSEETVIEYEPTIIEPKDEKISENVFQKIANWFDGIISKITETIENLF